MIEMLSEGVVVGIGSGYGVAAFAKMQLLKEMMTVNMMVDVNFFIN